MSRGHAARVFCGVLVVLALLPADAAQNRARRGVQRPIAAGVDGSIFRLDRQQRWTQVDGAGVRISVAPDGDPWVVNAANEIFRRVRSGFQRVPGTAIDIGIGGDGSVWIVGTDTGVYRFNGTDWDPVAGEGVVAVSAERFGVPWVADGNGRISHLRNSRFVAMDGGALDVGAGADVWLVGTDNAIYQLSPTGDWRRLGGSATRISAGAPGTFWAVNQDGGIYRGQNGAVQQIPGWASDIGANMRGEVWAIGDAERMGRGLRLR